MLVLLGSSINSALAAEIDVPASPDYRLPAAPKTEIIRFDHLGGMLPEPHSQPLLTITADGLLTVSAAWGGAETSQLLSRSELQALLHFVIAEQQFLNIRPAEISQQISQLQRQQGRFFAAADAPTTLIRIDLPQFRHSVEFYALDLMAGRFPEIEPLQNLLSVQTRLQALMDAAIGKPQ